MLWVTPTNFVGVAGAQDELLAGFSAAERRTLVTLPTCILETRSADRGR